jgi:putative membrane protein
VGHDVGASVLRALSVVALGAPPARASAFHGAPAIDTMHWNWDAGLAILLVASALLYAWGIVALWRKAGIGRGIRRADAMRFVLGWTVLAAALLSPLDAFAGRSFAVHMVQHELLMVVAAPLFVLARPLEAWGWALPAAVTRLLNGVARVPRVRDGWRWISGPIAAWCVHALALWLWHLPVLFRAALASEPLHVLQHVCFFASALAFWRAVFGGGARRPDGMSLACLVTTMLHTGALGALLTFAPVPWYANATQHVLVGFTALEDQQLGGLVMWVPGSLAYLIAALAIVGALLAPPRARHDAV